MKKDTPSKKSAPMSNDKIPQHKRMAMGHSILNGKPGTGKKMPS